MAKVVKISEIYGKLEERKEKSCWKRGVNELARYILSNAMDNGRERVELANLREVLLNGAKDFAQYSQGGQLIIYNEDVAICLCSPSELRRCTAKDGALKDPNRREIWMDVQARAAGQAWRLIRDCAASCAETVYAVRDNEKGKVIFTGSRFACLCRRGKIENETGEFGLTSRFEVVPA